MFEMETHYLDVGQGDCSVIVVKDTTVNFNKKTEFDKQIIRVVVFDCGSSRGAKAGNALLEKCVELRIQQIDVAIVSHFDRDHFNGFNFLFNLKKKVTKINQLFNATKFYTIGLIYKHYDLRLINASGRNKIKTVVSMYQAQNNDRYPSKLKLLESFRDYKSFLNGIARMAKRSGIVHVTERIFSGFPDGQDVDMGSTEDFLVHQKEWSPTVNGDSTSDFKNFIKVNFTRGDTDTILGQDLMNMDPNKSPVDVHLWCIAYNGHLLKNFSPHQSNPTAHGILKGTGSKNGDIANERSFGCILKFNDYTAWFGGDLPTSHEDKLVDSIINCTGGKNLSVLKASHHGSNESTSDVFLENIQPLQTIITCGPGVRSVNSPKREGSQGEENVHGHPGKDTMERLREWYDHLNEHNFDPGHNIFTTWVSRDRTYQGTSQIRFRMNEYFDEFGKDYTIITNSNVSVYAIPDGTVMYPTFQHYHSRFIPNKGSGIQNAFDQDDVNKVMLRKLNQISKSKNIPIDQMGYRFNLDAKKVYHGNWEFYRSSKKRNREDEVIETIEGQIVIVDEKGQKKRRVI